MFELNSLDTLVLWQIEVSLCDTCNRGGKIYSIVATQLYCDPNCLSKLSTFLGGTCLLPSCDVKYYFVLNKIIKVDKLHVILLKLLL